MLENQFIQLTSDSLASAKLRKPFPICLDDIDYKIFHNVSSQAYTATKIAALDENGNVLECEEEGVTQEDTISTDYKWLRLFGTTSSYLPDLYCALSEGKTFFLRLTFVRNGYTGYRYSQPLIAVDSLGNYGMSTVRYWCNEDAFGFPFATVGNTMGSAAPADLALPIRLHSPQNVQEDKTYVKANGEVVTLYAKYYKEWELETEFLSAEMHDKIIAALSCDYLYINGKRVTKSDNYQIDWDNYDLDCDGTTKIAKATCKVRENITNRNSNY